MDRCHFNETDLIRCNLNGIQAKNLRIESSDLYDSRFINSRLEKTVFSDCNLSRSSFRFAGLLDVQFVSCNVEEANFDNVEKSP